MFRRYRNQSRDLRPAESLTAPLAKVVSEAEIGIVSADEILAVFRAGGEDVALGIDSDTVVARAIFGIGAFLDVVLEIAIAVVADERGFLAVDGDFIGFHQGAQQGTSSTSVSIEPTA